MSIWIPRDRVSSPSRHLRGQSGILLPKHLLKHLLPDCHRPRQQMIPITSIVRMVADLERVVCRIMSIIQITAKGLYPCAFLTSATLPP